MTHIAIVNPNDLNNKVADELKKQSLVQPTDWSKFVKTSHSKDRLPEDPDWWFHRAAAIMRSIATRGPVGTQKLRTKYGGKKNRGHKPERFYKGSGNIIRKILQQLERAGFVEKGEKGVHKGKVITKKGKSFLDKLAKDIK